MPRSLHVFLSFGLLLVLSAPTFAQDEEIEAWFARGERFASKGLWRRAGNFFEKVTTADPEDEEAAYQLALSWLGCGSYEVLDAHTAAWVAKKPERKWILIRHDYLRELSRDEEALDLLRGFLGDRKDIEIESLIGRILEDQGKAEEAETIYSALIDRAQKEVIRSAPDLVGLARAQMFWPHGGDPAERSLIDARKADPEYLPTHVEFARLFLELKEIPAEVQREMKAALALRPRWPAYLALIVASLDLRLDMPLGEIQQQASQILSINPRHPVGLFERGMKELSDALWDKSRATFDEALQIAPRDKRLLSGAAALAFVIHDLERYEELKTRVLTLDPTFGEFHQIVAKGLNERRRWDESLVMMREAVAVNDKNHRLWDDLARYAFYIGEEQEGRQAIEKADALMKYGRKWRTNMGRVMQLLEERFETLTSDHFIMKVHEDDVEVLRRILPPFLEQSYAELVERYDLEPKHPVIFDVFQRNTDFSVRTMGTIGLGALGVCFGPTVYMFISRDPRMASNWEGTAHHELAHVFTLQRSRGRLPRWFTEGLSSWEEVRRNPSWGRNMELLLHNTLESDELLGVMEFDAAFYGPQILYAYFQAGLECQFIEETWGIESIRKMLTLYGDDKLTKEVLKEALDTTPKEFDDRFKDWVRKMLAPMKRIPTYSTEAMERFEKNIEAGVDVEDNRIKLAWGKFRRGSSIDAAAAMKPLVDAGCTRPEFRYLLGMRALSLKNKGEARKIFEELMAEGFEDVDMTIILAKMLDEEGKGDEALELWKRARNQNPWNIDPRGSPYIVLADRYMKAGDAEAWARETAAYCALVDNAVDKRMSLVEFHKERAQYEEALRYLDEVRSMNPFAAMVQVERGRILNDLGKKDEALEAYEIAVALQPEGQAEIETRLNLARLLISLDRKDDAVYHLVRILELKPGHEEAMKLLEVADSEKK